jgi:hypothetical protein
MRTSEVRLHSAILADLLNPFGKHEQGDIFLKLFLEYFNYSHFDSSTAKVIPEHYIGPVTETKGGRIDILGTDAKGRHLIIENKIYAQDQNNQLIRYHNFDQFSKILYLTLDGKDPENYSISNENRNDSAQDTDQTFHDEEFARLTLVKDRDFQCISYKRDIIEWLELCKNKSIDFPLLHGILSQYIFLIKSLTNQSTNQKMSTDIAKQITSSTDSLKAYFEARNAYEIVRNEIFAEFVNAMKAISIKGKDEISFSAYNKDFNEFYFTSNRLTELNLQISFGFDNANHTEFGFGFKWIDSKKPNNSLSFNLREGIEKLPFSTDFDSSDSWPAYAFSSDEVYRTWDDNSYIKIKAGEMIEFIESTIRQLYGIVLEASKMI